MFEIYYSLTIILVMTILLALELYKPSVIMFGALLMFYFGGIISINEIFLGFSNHGMLTVAVLYIVASTLQGSYTFGYYITKLLKGRPDKSFYFRLMLPVSLLSAFLNNTPVVASLIPSLKKWSNQYGFPISKVLIPLSYAAIIGGMCTLIGSSTNLVVHGLLLENDLPGLSFFELGKIGLPIVIIITLYFSLIGKKLLPVRKGAIIEMGDEIREFVVEVKIEDAYPFIGKTIEQANLRHLKGLYLFQIVRDGKEIVSVPPYEKLIKDDRLFFTGLPSTIFELVKTPGLRIVKDLEFNLNSIDSDIYKTYEAVISNSSPLVGVNVRDSGFRTKYHAVILAIHRNGHRINKKVGDIVLQPNDTLFILAKKDFETRWYHSTDFSLVTASVHSFSKPKIKSNLAIIILIAMIVAVAKGLIDSMLIAAIIAAGIFLLTKTISFEEARKSIDFNVLLVIVSALGIGKAILNSGLADKSADLLFNIFEPYGIIGILIGLFLITNIYSEFITNNAAAAMVFPIAYIFSQKVPDIPIHAFMITIAIAASSSFSTPIGYQTNLMVYGPGGYKFSDYLRTGIFINLIVGIITVLLINYWYC
ncbi:MAG: anion permease [Bacteroidales bacterium]|nr:anion permease [Bacteroidales bacterium]